MYEQQASHQATFTFQEKTASLGYKTHAGPAPAGVINVEDPGPGRLPAKPFESLRKYLRNTYLQNTCKKYIYIYISIHIRHIYMIHIYIYVIQIHVYLYLCVYILLNDMIACVCGL